MEYFWGRVLMILQSLTTTMHPVLVSTFLDCAPSVFSPTPTDLGNDLQAIQALMRISQHLYGHLLRVPEVSIVSAARSIDFIDAL